LNTLYSFLVTVSFSFVFEFLFWYSLDCSYRLLLSFLHVKF
jgi:hypothetical protein